MSTDSLQDNPRKSRADEAAEWFLRLKDDDVAERELSEWLEWCADPENLREFQRTRSMWRSFNAVAPAATELLETLLAEKESIRPPTGEQRDTASFSAQPSMRFFARRSRTWMRGAVAASLVVIAISSAWYIDHNGAVTEQGPRAEVQPTIRSSILPDGSALTLAPKTEIAVEFDGALRSLALSYGDAYFEVRPDEAKPFVVRTAGLRITAIGTAFDVRSRADRVLVTVQEGSVEVARVAHTGAASGDSWRVDAGYQIAYDARNGAAQIAAVDIERALSWREGRLEYFSEPLNSVVADVSRYSARPIEIGDPQLAALTFTGTVFTGSIDDWLGAVESTFPVRIVVTRDDHVLLLRRSASEVPGDTQ